jgi:hypothetical protein
VKDLEDERLRLVSELNTMNMHIKQLQLEVKTLEGRQQQTIAKFNNQVLAAEVCGLFVLRYGTDSTQLCFKGPAHCTSLLL